MTNLSTGADPAVVGPYLAEVLDEPAWTSCEVGLITGGKSNLTYRVTSAAGSVVLRRPPLGKLLPTAHDVAREHRVIAALAGSGVPVPAALHLCGDTTVVGAPFLVMQDVPGPVVRDSLPAGYAEAPSERRAIGHALVDTLATLHALEPAAVGLGDFGRPEGFLARQVSRWTRQWESTPSDPIPSLDALAAALAGAVPRAPAGPIVHGDFRLDNTVLDPDRPGRIAAVLDWEMSTLGDPLADLGLTLVYWAEPGDPMVLPTGAATALPGFPSRDEIVERYAATTGRPVDALGWYVAFGYFKLAVVAAGIVARVRAGAMLGEGFRGLEAGLLPLVDLGRRHLAGWCR
ncbi:MAG TPA: phosphotransferase family protein [Cryptosporangiaceae bacterium]|nr:phosphotransferase family protein [Cryptosporangiaceae bacterium]